MLMKNMVHFSFFLFLFSSFLFPGVLQAESFRIDTTGQSIVGSLEEMQADGTVRYKDSKEGRVSSDALVALRRTDQFLPPVPQREHVILANGDRLPGQIVRLNGQKLRFRLEQKEIDLSLSQLLVLWWQAPEGTEVERTERLLRRLVSEERRRDVVLLRNGDQVEGTLTVLDDKIVRLRSGRRRLNFDRDKVSAIALNTELLFRRKPRKKYYRVVLRNGGRLSLGSVKWRKDKPLVGATNFKTDIHIPAKEVVAIYVLQGPAVYLSDHKPKRVRYNFFGSISWPIVANGSVAGQDLRIGQDSYDKGLGTHSETQIVYVLNGQYRRFEALAGLDPRTGQRGHVRLKVLVDGKEGKLSRKGILSSRSQPLPIRVDVTGVEELTLVVEFGEGGPVQDHVNWADARLIK